MMIRRAEAKDAEKVLDLLLQVHKVHSDGRPDIFKPGGIKYTTEELAELFKNDERPIYVYDDDGTVKGYAFCIYEYTEDSPGRYAMKSLYIDDLCVDEKERGQHIGTALYDYVCKVAKENGCYNVTLHVWTLNPAAIAFYEKVGMKELMKTMEHIL